MDALQDLRTKWTKLAPHLDERQRRLLAAADAQVLGYGGVSLVAEASGMSRTTIHKALAELDKPPLPGQRIRHVGGGRKLRFEEEPRLVAALEKLVDPSTRGDPQSPLRWTCLSTRQIANALEAKGFAIGRTVVGEMLYYLGYSLQGNAKVLEGKQHPDRDAQFHYINRLAKRQIRRKMPVISVDTKKKELVGGYKNAGSEWCPEGEPTRVNTYDFPDPKIGKAIPYGVYDVARNEAWVNVGCDHDTACFAVESIRRWWRRMGQIAYADADRLLICADGGGSNGSRPRLWKAELQRLAAELGMPITVCHFPPGTSKWNKIEHRLFAQISMNWRGRPLVTHEVVVNLIAATTTTTGLRVEADLDTSKYPRKIKVTNEEFKAIKLCRHKFHGEWNYTIDTKD